VPEAKLAYHQARAELERYVARLPWFRTEEQANQVRALEQAAETSRQRYDYLYHDYGGADAPSTCNCELCAERPLVSALW
jgi:hypothetical protein